MKTTLTPKNYLPKKIGVIIGAIITLISIYFIYTDISSPTNMLLDFVQLSLGLYILFNNLKSGSKEL
jgi:hypothetical protein